MKEARFISLQGDGSQDKTRKAQKAFKADFTGNMHRGFSNETDQDDTDAEELPRVPNIFQTKPHHC